MHNSVVVAVFYSQKDRKGILMAVLANDGVLTAAINVPSLYHRLPLHGNQGTREKAIS